MTFSLNVSSAATWLLYEEKIALPWRFVRRAHIAMLPLKLPSSLRDREPAIGSQYGHVGGQCAASKPGWS